MESWLLVVGRRVPSWIGHCRSGQENKAHQDGGSSTADEANDETGGGAITNGPTPTRLVPLSHFALCWYAGFLGLVGASAQVYCPDIKPRQQHSVEAVVSMMMLAELLARGNPKE
jgi:hypothetical protein